PSQRPAPSAPAYASPRPVATRPNGNPAPGAPAAASAEIQKLRFEVQRLEMLVKKLQSDLEAERQYVASLESHMRTLQEAE
ncbi:MAG: hypothetical protein WAL69_14605, partial [Candidatus Acidiferrales bacterium]